MGLLLRDQGGLRVLLRFPRCGESLSWDALASHNLAPLALLGMMLPEEGHHPVLPVIGEGGHSLQRI